ncbi:MAG: glycosyltransferase [Candidatus Cloacimonadaceae bacterium]|nr:glycosyltransferase [Candidatus Cloacimonadaceae bacterium]
MRVLFVVTGNKGRLSYVFENQLRTLAPHLSEYKIHLIQGKGVIGYLRNVKPLNITIRNFKPDLIHAHYSLCGFIAALSFFRPIVVSLMGSDCRNKLSIYLIRFFNNVRWSYTIVKSNEMANILSLRKRTCVIPNGVDFDRFPFIDKDVACKEVGFDQSKKNIIFVSNPNRAEKNFAIAEKAILLLEGEDFVLHAIYEIPHSMINIYMRAADAMILTSFHEGSPNVVKEAMACGLPIVSTDVGDVKQNTKGLDNCFIVGMNIHEIAAGLRNAVNSSISKEGRLNLIKLGLTAGNARDAILRIYGTLKK